MKVSVGGDSRYYMFGAIGLYRGLEKIGLEDVEYRCCGFSCLSISLSMIYSPNRAFHILDKREGIFKKIFGKIYEEGLKPLNAVEMTIALASSKVRIHIPFLRDRFEEVLNEIVPDVPVNDLKGLSVMVLDLEDETIKTIEGVSLRYALMATCRFTPTSDPFDGRYVSCSRAVGLPEGEVVLRITTETSQFRPSKALEFVSLAANVRKEYIEDIRLKKAKFPIDIKFKGKLSNFRVMDSIYKEVLRRLSQSIEE